MILRQAMQADAGGIAQVHIDSWLSTYRGILADQLLDQLSLAERTENWSKWLEPSHPDQAQPPNWVWVLESPSGQIVGFVCGGPERTGLPDFEGEIYALYLLDAWHGQGWGKRLLFKGFDLLRAQGHSALLVWVASRNLKAGGFYASQGGKICLQRSLEMAGQVVDETGYGWL
jgi:GNAT superfamily N-acetyltransferase